MFSNNHQIKGLCVSNKKIVNGKGNETYVARCLANKLGVVAEFPALYLGYEQEFLQNLSKTNYRECVNDLTDALVGKLDFAPTRLYFNPDSAGRQGDRSDIIVTNNIMRQGYSLKWNSPELSSLRFGPQTRANFLTGNEIDLLGAFEHYPSHRVLYRESRKELAGVLDRCYDIMVEDLKSQYVINKQPCIDNISRMISGSDEDMLLVKIQKRGNKCSFIIDENHPIVTDVDLNSIGKNRRNNSLSTSLFFNVRTVDGRLFKTNIRMKNGNEYTHGEKGNPKGFKTSVTRKEILK